MAKILVPSSGPESWKRFLAEPEKQWKRGYSARALAYCWESARGDLPPEVARAFAGAPALAELEVLIAVPEHQVPLPGGRRPTQSDLWVLARGQEGLVSIAVEGKVAEAFGPTVGEWLEDASPGKHKRLAYLREVLGLPAAPPETTRYQLLHRTAAALIEAERFAADHAVLAVHSFSQEDRWFEDFTAFCHLLGVEAEVGHAFRVPDDRRPALWLAWVRGEASFLEA